MTWHETWDWWDWWDVVSHVGHVGLWWIKWLDYETQPFLALLQMVLSLQDQIWSHSQSLWKAELKAALGCCQSMMSINGTISFWYGRGTRICKRRRSWDCYHTSQSDVASQHSARLHSFQHNPVPFLHTLPPLPPFFLLWFCSGRNSWLFQSFLWFDQ